MATRDLVEYIRHGREERNLEYKCSLNWSSAEHRAKITKAALGLANITDGGVIVIGMRVERDRYVPEGVSAADLPLLRQDDVSAHINEYANPPVELTLSHVTHDGATFVIIEVQPFRESPVICRKDGEGRLRRGAIYTRSRAKHETVEVPSEVEMREILERATELRLRRYLETLGRAGFRLTTPPSDDKARFEEQRRGL